VILLDAGSVVAKSAAVTSLVSVARFGSVGSAAAIVDVADYLGISGLQLYQITS